MSDWQERITRETAPAIRVEHELRYRVAAPLILACETWADLGCGNGLAAAAALGDRRPRRAVLVDLDAHAVACAKAELELPHAITVCGDLTDEGVLGRIERALLIGEGDRVVTCFEVVEHLATFLPLLEWSTRLAHEHRVTFLMSVPNDAFWSIENPHHRTIWGEAAFEQLLSLLPPERTVLRQIALMGSAVVGVEGAEEPYELTVSAGGSGTVSTHLIVAFGSKHAEAVGQALVTQADQLSHRRWERERESNLAIAEETVRIQSATIAEQHEQLRSHTAEFKEWRAYIHRLEEELGHPLSGVTPKPASAPIEAPVAAQAGDDPEPHPADSSEGGQ